MSTQRQGGSDPNMISVGNPALDEVLGGGLSANRFYMVQGVPGSGKTTLALQFMLEGLKQGESVLYVTLSETEEEIRAIARSHGWSLDGVHVLEIVPSESSLSAEEQYTVFQPDEVELDETIKFILTEVERRRPARAVFDSLSELRLLAGTPLRYRRQMLGLKQYFSGRRCTVLVLDDLTGSDDDPQLQSIAHGIIELRQETPLYGAEQRRLRVVKYRGMQFVGGQHDFRIERGGLRIFPRLVAAGHRGTARGGPLSSGVTALDALLGGGVERGTSTLLSGAPGTGKSTIALQYAVAAAQRGERAAVFLFDESIATLRKRLQGLGIEVEPLLRSGRLTLQQIDPGELSLGEFAHIVIRAGSVEQASVVVIDSLNGYLNAMPSDRMLQVQLHELLTRLGQCGTATLLVSVHRGLIGGSIDTVVDASYLADTVVLLRYFENHGRVCGAISVLKKRSGEHERTIRAFEIRQGGVSVGPPLEQFQGVLTGVPTYVGDTLPTTR
ncbi:MAG TPA: ATPase domain-containing protein [Albitalea sp.]|uniref:ATPase domain-containing protein n=1 Tax=Piscinibacter sp. TaxID=1903157 RepID=UPI002ED15BF8